MSAMRQKTIEWVHECNRIMLEYGLVDGAETYPTRHQARYRARSLIRGMVDLNMHTRPQLGEHVERVSSGWLWTVEWLGPERRPPR